MRHGQYQTQSKYFVSIIHKPRFTNTMSGYDGWQYTHDGVRVGAKMVARAQNENEPVVPGTVFLSYHGEGRPWGRTVSDSNHHISQATYLDAFQLVCIDLILKVDRSRGPIIHSLKPPPTTSSTTLTNEQLEKQIDTPTFELTADRRTFNSDWGGKFPRDRALEIESELFKEYFRHHSNKTTRRAKRRLRRNEKYKQAYYDKLEVPDNVDSEEVDREYRKFLAAQERDAVERGRPPEDSKTGEEGSKTGKEGLFSNKFYSANDLEEVAKQGDEKNGISDDSDGANDTTPGTAWSENEKIHFFELLGRVGRHRLSEIAESMGSKSLVEVEEYHDLLYTASQHQKKVFNARVQAGEEFIPERDKPVSYKDIPAAAEMSDKWIALEESFSHSIAARSNEAPLPEGEEPFQSLDVDDIEEEEEEEEKEEDEEDKQEPDNLLNSSGFLSLASKVFYPNPANGMDIQSKEYNTDLPVFKGIEADVMKELLHAAVDKTRQLVTNMNLTDGAHLPRLDVECSTVGNMQFVQGLRYSSLSRFFRQYFERSGSERLETLFPEVRFPESVLTSKTVDGAFDAQAVKWECRNINAYAMPKLYRNTALLSASLENVSRIDKSKFLDAPEKKRVEGLLKEQMRYAEKIDEGDIDMDVRSEGEESDLPEEMFDYELRKALGAKGGEEPDADHLYPMQPSLVPDELDFMHTEETGFLERLDERNSQIEETGLARLFAAAAPYRYSRIFQQINRVMYEQDKRSEDDFVKQRLRYKYDEEGKEINLWKQKLPEVRETYNYYPDKDFPLYGAEPDTHKRGPGGGLVQPDNTYPETVSYEDQTKGKGFHDRPRHTDGSVIVVYRETSMVRSFLFRRPKPFYGVTNVSVIPGEGATSDVMDCERVRGSQKLIDGMRQYYHKFTGTPPTNPYDIYYDEGAVNREADLEEEPAAEEPKSGKPKSDSLRPQSGKEPKSGSRRTRVVSSESSSDDDATWRPVKKRRTGRSARSVG